ncbi:MULTISPECIES: hypothetical protein, partial [unclassified Pseudomonas]|uniref:hypothetical protein n=1 Tax=unclassified Pseudomonas TaxID=196821 RepID=UPI0030D8CFBC
VDGANGLKGLFSSVARTKTNAPNKSGRFVGPSSVCFHTVCSGAVFVYSIHVAKNNLWRGSKLPRHNHITVS